jgi:hypothetical protein
MVASIWGLIKMTMMMFGHRRHYPCYGSIRGSMERCCASAVGTVETGDDTGRLAMKPAI